MDQLEKFLEELFTKKISYQLPANAKEVIVKIAPWLTLIALVISLPALFAVFGMGSFVASMGAVYGVRFGTWYYLGIAVLAVQLVLMAMSVPGLMNRQIKGWRYVFYADLVAAVYGIVSSGNIGGLIWSLLGSAIGLYILFQVKSYYSVAGGPQKTQTPPASPTPPTPQTPQ